MADAVEKVAGVICGEEIHISVMKSGKIGRLHKDKQRSSIVANRGATIILSNSQENGRKTWSYFDESACYVSSAPFPRKMIILQPIVM